MKFLQDSKEDMREDTMFNLNQKQLLRNEIKERLIKGKKDNKRMSELITNKLFEDKDYKEAKSIFVYLSTENEVSTDEIIKIALAEKKKVYVPVTNDIINLAEINSNTQYIKGMYGIREPKHYKIDNNKVIDLAIVPLMAFDKEKNRLGHGKGYYDRFLLNFKGVIIGLGFSFQEVNDTGAEAHDIKLQKIITEKHIYY